MDDEKINLRTLRRELFESFEKMALRDDIPFNPNEDFKTLDLCSRLYDEEMRDRRINIDFDPESELSMNGFAKTFGFEPDQVLLLTVFVNEQSMDFERLWAICRGWLHHRMIAEALLKGMAG